MEREVSFGFSVHLSESTKARSSSRQREDHLAFDLEAGRGAAFPDLQIAPCVLRKAKLGCTGCGYRTGDAPNEPGGKTHLPNQHGRPRAGSEREGESKR